VQDQRKPMIADSRITVCSSDFAAYLNKTKAMNLSTKAAASMLGAVGARRTRIQAHEGESPVAVGAPPPGLRPAEIRPTAGGQAN